jgi:Leucine rich repeat
MLSFAFLAAAQRRMGRMSAKPPVRWFQFRLRSLLIVLTLLAVVPGGYVVHERGEAKRQKEAVAKLKELHYVEVYARSNWLHSLLVPGAPGEVVGLAIMHPRAYDSEQLAPLAELHTLIWLDLDGIPLTDEALVHLSRLHNLKRLRLDETQITDAGLAHLSGLKRIDTLNLSYTKITDAGLIHLQQLPLLEELYIQKTQVTSAGVSQLQQALPALDIIR